MKKIMKITALLAVCMCVFTACGKTKTTDTQKTRSLPAKTAEPNPDITHPEGQYYVSDGKNKAEGAIVSLSEDVMRVSVLGQEEEFVLSDKAKWEIDVYNKDPKNPRIVKGTMLLITYTQKNLVKTAETMDLITAN